MTIGVERILPAARDRLVTVGQECRLTEAARLLSAPGRQMVIVCDGAGIMAGVVTRTDIVRQMRHCRGCACTAVCAAVMTTDVVSCRPEDRLQDIWSTMKDRGLQNVPIVDPEGRPVGLLSAADAVQALLSEVEYEEELLKGYVMCVGYR